MYLLLQNTDSNDNYCKGYQVHICINRNQMLGSNRRNLSIYSNYILNIILTNIMASKGE